MSSGKQIASKKEKVHVDWRELKAKKRKWREEIVLKELEKKEENEIEVSRKKMKAVERSSTKIGRQYTISIALPGSILDNAQSQELRTYLVGQIARAAVIFKVNEIIVFDESGMMTKSATMSQKTQSTVQMVHILQYLECPQYLRKTLFPRHNHLQYAGLLNPLDCPHHMRKDDEMEFREGVVLEKAVKPGRGSYVDVGLIKEVEIDKELVPGIRVTVQLLDRIVKAGKMRQGKAVSPSMPSTHAGLYWGYEVRMASCLGDVFKDSPYEGGYDLTVGTSERGKSVDNFQMPHFRHLLIVFGGLNGLEASLDADPDLNVTDPCQLFNHYLNTCPEQGSRTIRTEEAILITLSAIRTKMAASN